MELGARPARVPGMRPDGTFRARGRHRAVGGEGRRAFRVRLGRCGLQPRRPTAAEGAHPVSGVTGFGRLVLGSVQGRARIRDGAAATGAMWGNGWGIAGPCSRGRTRDGGFRCSGSDTTDQELAGEATLRQLFSALKYHLQVVAEALRVCTRAARGRALPDLWARLGAVPPICFARTGAFLPLTLAERPWAVGIQKLGVPETPQWAQVHQYSEEVAHRFCELAPGWKLRHYLLELALWTLTKSRAPKSVRGRLSQDGRGRATDRHALACHRRPCSDLPEIRHRRAGVPSRGSGRVPPRAGPLIRALPAPPLLRVQRPSPTPSPRHGGKPDGGRGSGLAAAKRSAVHCPHPLGACHRVRGWEGNARAPSFHSRVLTTLTPPRPPQHGPGLSRSAPAPPPHCLRALRPTPAQARAPPRISARALLLHCTSEGRANLRTACTYQPGAGSPAAARTDRARALAAAALPPRPLPPPRHPALHLPALAAARCEEAMCGRAPAGRGVRGAVITPPTSLAAAWLLEECAGLLALPWATLPQCRGAIAGIMRIAAERVSDPNVDVRAAAACGRGRRGPCVLRAARQGAPPDPGCGPFPAPVRSWPASRVPSCGHPSCGSCSAAAATRGGVVRSATECVAEGLRRAQRAWPAVASPPNRGPDAPRRPLVAVGPDVFHCHAAPSLDRRGLRSKRTHARRLRAPDSDRTPRPHSGQPGARAGARDGGGGEGGVHLAPRAAVHAAAERRRHRAQTGG